MKKLPTPSAAIVREWYNDLNRLRSTFDLQPLPLSYLAQMASDSTAIQGEAIKVSKSTVAAVLHGNYPVTTELPIRRRLAQVIIAKWEDLAHAYDNVPPLQPQPRESKAVDRKKSHRAALRNVRCTPEGYIIHNKRTYYAGYNFAGQLCQVSALRSKDKAVCITNGVVDRVAYPVDPSNNQLGYKATQ